MVSQRTPSVLQLGEVIAHHQLELERYHMHLSNTLKLQVFVIYVVDVTASYHQLQ